MCWLLDQSFALDIPEQFLPSRIAQLYSKTASVRKNRQRSSRESHQLDHGKCGGDPFDYEQIIGLSEVKPQLPEEGIDAPNVLNNISAI